eukprot:TRINITY_DN14881_c0_g1_i1.p1 TRINITY_DN14881_c0_g1~~TRINITY_DN14881_c0_g1_i1.p1  ORF type:complete len:216 (-),score=35.50 TRINITY_DN14881_c0_g1_i1:11-613(-)
MSRALSSGGTKKQIVMTRKKSKLPVLSTSTPVTVSSLLRRRKKKPEKSAKDPVLVPKQCTKRSHSAAGLCGDDTIPKLRKSNSVVERRKSRVKGRKKKTNRKSARIRRKSVDKRKASPKKSKRSNKVGNRPRSKSRGSRNRSEDKKLQHVAVKDIHRDFTNNGTIALRISSTKDAVTNLTDFLNACSEEEAQWNIKRQES